MLQVAEDEATHCAGDVVVRIAHALDDDVQILEYVRAILLVRHEAPLD